MREGTMLPEDLDVQYSGAEKLCEGKWSSV